MCARMDKGKAVTAAAHKRAHLIYRLLTKGGRRVRRVAIARLIRALARQSPFFTGSGHPVSPTKTLTPTELTRDREAASAGGAAS